MIRFRSLLSGAFLCAASTTSLWAQVPVVPPSALVPNEIPIITARSGIAGQAPSAPAVGGLNAQTPQSFLQGLNATPGQDSASLRLLPPIVKPGEQATPPKSQSESDKVPIVSSKQANQATATPKPVAGPAGYAPHFKAEHPDLSLPTGVPIVKEAQLAKPKPEASAEPLKLDGPQQKASPMVAAGPAEAAPSIKPASGLPSVTVPIVKSAALVKTGEAPAASAAPAAGSPTAAPSANAPQDGPVIPRTGAGVPVVRPEIALPPIKPGEEFPRTQPDQTARTANPTAAPAKQTTSPIKTPRFEPVPVGTGTPEQGVGPVGDGFVQPAQPLLGAESFSGATQLPATTDPMEIGPEQHLHEHHQGPVGNNYLEDGFGGDCENCGGAGCSQCGMGAWNGLGNRDLLHVGGGCDNGCFGLMPCARNYFIGDVLYWTRNGGDVVGTDFGGVYNYDWNFGTQVTMGTRTDPLYGHELVYFGLFELDAGHTDFSPAGAIDARFNPTGGLGYGQTYAFFDGEEVTQTASSRLHSFQLNRTRLGWDVVQSHLGLRYIWFEDEYQLQSRNVFGESGRLSLDARNQLIGPEVGVKLFYDVGRRISFSSHWKLGGYLNAYRSSTYLENDGVQELSNSDSGTGFSASFDLGVNAHVHLTQRMRLRGGYGILWLWDVASVSGNFPYTLTPSSGTSTNDSESAIFHGANVGLEFYW